MDKRSGVTRCDGAGCPRKDNCYRHRLPPSIPYFQFVAAPVDLDGACRHFWPATLGNGLAGERLEIEDACRGVGEQIIGDAAASMFRVDKYRSLLLDCPNYVWDAAVEMAGGGSHPLAVKWLLAPCRKLGMNPPNRGRRSWEPRTRKGTAGSYRMPELTRLFICPDLHEAGNLDEVEAAIRRENPARTIFLGDYFDQFDDTPDDAARTAAWLRHSLTNTNRVHLWGNHDLPYGFPHLDAAWCPGFT